MAAKAVRTRAKGLAMPAAELVLSGVELGVALAVALRATLLVALTVDSVLVAKVVRVVFSSVEMVELACGSEMTVPTDGTAVRVVLVVVALAVACAAEMYDDTCDERCDERCDEMSDEYEVVSDEAEVLIEDATDEVVETALWLTDEAAPPVMANSGE